MAGMRWLGVPLLLWILATASPVQAQTSVASAPEWQKAAGGTMAFEVASVHEDKGPFKRPSFALSSDDNFREPDGRFHADFALPNYIQFAYKILLTPEERRAIWRNYPGGWRRIVLISRRQLRCTSRRISTG